MTFWILTATITFCLFAVAAAAASGAVAWAAPMMARRYEGCSAAACAAALFRLRMMPAAVAAFVAFGIALPTLLQYEPRDTREALPLTIVVLACLGAALVIRGAVRAMLAWQSTRIVAREWRRRGRRLDGFETPLPLFAIDESFPTVAVVGVARPALFIAERVLRECPEDEVRAMLHHECAHVATRDNLKRFLMRACPDFVGTELDRAWARAAEEAADAAVVERNPVLAVELAQALIHVARLAPTPVAPALASAFYLGGSIESRVRRLVEPEPMREPAGTLRLSVLTLAGFSALALLVTSEPGLHRFIEAALQLLP